MKNRTNEINGMDVNNKSCRLVILDTVSETFQNVLIRSFHYIHTPIRMQSFDMRIVSTTGFGKVDGRRHQLLIVCDRFLFLHSNGSMHPLDNQDDRLGFLSRFQVLVLVIIVQLGTHLERREEENR